MSSNIMDLKKEIIRLRVALADTEALELGTAERLEKVTAQLESEKASHAAWEKMSLLEYSELMQERDALRDALIEIKEWTERYTQPGHPIVTFADKALAKLKENQP